VVFKKQEIVKVGMVSIDPKLLKASADSVVPVVVEASPEVAALKEQYAKNWAAADLQDKLSQERALEDQELLRRYGEQSAKGVQ
jgi:hypothetical protein